MLRTLIVTLSILALWAVIAEVNHALAPVHVYLFVGGLCVTVGALTLPLSSGFAASFIGGLIFDSMTPVAYGTHAVLFAIAHAVVYHLRDRLPREETTGRVVIALLANLGIFLAFSFVQISRSPAPGAAWPRLIADLVCSQVFLTLAAPWFFAFQQRLLLLARVEPERAL